MIIEMVQLSKLKENHIYLHHIEKYYYKGPTKGTTTDFYRN